MTGWHGKMSGGQGRGVKGLSDYHTVWQVGAPVKTHHGNRFGWVAGSPVGETGPKQLRGVCREPTARSHPVPAHVHESVRQSDPDLAKLHCFLIL